MKLAMLLLIISGWFYLRRKFKKKDGPSFPWVDWFLGIMISLYSLIVVFMLFGVEQKRAGMLAIGIAFFWGSDLRRLDAKANQILKRMPL